MEKIFTISAAVCAGTAIAFFLADYKDATFVVAVIGCALWFVGFRFRVKQTNTAKAKKRTVRRKIIDKMFVKSGVKTKI